MKYKAEEIRVCIIGVIVAMFSAKPMPKRYYRRETVKEINIILQKTLNTTDLSPITFITNLDPIGRCVSLKT